ncbi:unnamed protein product [Linum trigynum]|uniref:Uncharacterized protein n=1 Tax=Linum trigynum TaxID=586398 RepID=A0AAV2E9M9_9ROSI
MPNLSFSPGDGSSLVHSERRPISAISHPFQAARFPDLSLRLVQVFDLQEDQPLKAWIPPLHLHLSFEFQKFMRLINGRDKGRKPKLLKISADQPCFGRPWSLFEDQALFILVHDMGPNWELVGDAIINIALRFNMVALTYWSLGHGKHVIRTIKFPCC